MQKRMGHGDTHEQGLLKSVGALVANAAAAVGATSSQHSFDYMFEWSAEDRLPPGPDTVVALQALGETMSDSVAGPGDAASPPDGSVPAAYTYFGQFIDHDVTLDEGSATLTQLADPSTPPLQSLSGVRNTRTATLDLDSVYGKNLMRDEANPERMKLGPVFRLNGTKKPLLRPPLKSELNDLPRSPPNANADLDRAAQIGDPRNDENVIVAQLHTAFLKAHNTLVDQKKTFEEARTELTLRYQSAVVDDFLALICDPAVHKKVLANGPSHWRITDPDKLFMPAEFAFAAYRFGHSMVRTKYNFNLNFDDTGLDLMFTFTALSGTFAGLDAPQLPDNWIVQWERLLALPGGGKPQTARPIDTRLTDFLFKLQNTFGKVQGTEAHTPPAVARLAPMLASRNLLRGYFVGLPTGQAMAKRFGIASMSGQALVDALPTQAMKTAAQPFLERTPLWFYLLAEAGNPAGANGQHLGELGSTILMETFVNLVTHTTPSIFDKKIDTAALRPTTLAQIIELAAAQDAGFP